MRKIILILLIFAAPVCGFAQQSYQSQMPPQFLPQFVAGSLPASDWESKILFVNLSGGPNAVTIEFFDNSGNPLVLSTSKGTNSSFVVNLPKPAPDAIASDVLEILRNTGSFVTGWAKVTSDKPFAVDLEFRQFAPGSAEPIGKADVPPSPVENVLTYPLAPNNGIALVNPGSQDAKVSFTAFDRSGSKLKEGTFVLARGAKMSSFFNQAPFFLDSTGIIVIASNIPLSGIAMDFEGLVFKTIPRIPTPRRLDSRIADSKIGFVYIHSNDRQPQPNIQARLAEYVGFQQALLDKEMPLNGFNRVQLPYDLDENGLPKVEVVNGGSREQYFDYSKNGAERTLLDQFEKIIDASGPSYWAKKVVFVDMWLDRVIDGQPDDISANGGPKRSMISAVYLPFLKKAYFGDKRRHRGVPIPEFGGKSIPTLRGYGFTFEDMADGAISLANHENGHSFWLLSHSGVAVGTSPFGNMVGVVSENGCLNPTRSAECILLPVEANGVSLGMISRPNDFDWLGWGIDPRDPRIEVLSKELNGDKLKVTFRAEDLESGINSFSINTFATSWTRFWRPISHLDNLESTTIEADVSGLKSYIYLRVRNNRGYSNSIKLF